MVPFLNFRHQKQSQAKKRKRKRKQNHGSIEDCGSPPRPQTNLDISAGDSASKLFRISAAAMVDDNNMESLGAECEFKHVLYSSFCLSFSEERVTRAYMLARSVSLNESCISYVSYHRYIIVTECRTSHSICF